MWCCGGRGEEAEDDDDAAAKYDSYNFIHYYRINLPGESFVSNVMIMAKGLRITSLRFPRRDQRVETSSLPFYTSTLHLIFLGIAL